MATDVNTSSIILTDGITDRRYTAHEGDILTVSYPSGAPNWTTPIHIINESVFSVDGGKGSFHVDEFRDQMELIGATFSITGRLPEYCFGKLEPDGEIVGIVRGETGHYRIDLQPEIPLIELNASIGVSKAQADAMMHGSMFGWNTPGADPRKHDPDFLAVSPTEDGAQYPAIAQSRHLPDEFYNIGHRNVRADGDKPHSGPQKDIDERSRPAPPKRRSDRMER